MNNSELFNEAKQFLEQYYMETNKSKALLNERLSTVKAMIAKEGSYEHTIDELTYGARVAWRNSNRCIGRLFWDRLEVVDARHVTSSEEVFPYLVQHIEKATNAGKIKPMITVFPPASHNKRLKIWNHQLLRYAGYETENEIIGDPDSIPFTKMCEQLGWQGKRSYFDLLPLVIQWNDETPVYVEIPKEIIMEVPIEHQEYNLFGDLEVKWYAVPIISDMRLEIGGLQYTAAPFNGWYMGTEIGARNLADEKRYHLLPLIADQMGLNRNKARSLWKDRALVELNAAVLDSFQKHGVTVVDHHTAAKQFSVFERKEQEAGRELTGKWSWLVPPLSPATTHMFHRPYSNTIKKPNYFK
ncbi:MULTISPECIES: nitric oxide synthase oxygenase [unclassified Virgibacillus]|uniref:nitric oxide synthase oxygenase n=1 Tax=unclassified Virgibacillus TaxID=2620237 RepID=UPI0024DE1BBB|nr:nitric oxide synthase oxygenase [Virgibacillus sp. LDC-1]